MFSVLNAKYLAQLSALSFGFCTTLLADRLDAQHSFLCSTGVPDYSCPNVMRYAFSKKKV